MDRSVSAAVLAGLVATISATPACKSEPATCDCTTRHVLLDPSVVEPSGLVRSRRHPGIFWTHGDSGCAPKLYAITSDGTLVRSFRIAGGSCVDWEDIAVDDSGHLYLADTGNNRNERRDLAIHRFEEPDPNADSESVQVERSYRFRYAEQRAFPDPEHVNFDAEAIFWTNGLYLLSKHRGDMKTELYRIPESATESEVAIEPIGDFLVGGDKDRYGGMVTAADITEDGRFLAILTYHALFLFERPAHGDQYLSHPINRIDFDQNQMQQTESLAWDGWSLLIGNEDRKLFRLGNPFAKRTEPFPK